MFSHPRGRQEDGFNRSKRKRSTLSFFFSLGNSTGKRISLLFAILNFIALLQYRTLVSRTLQATVEEYNEEWMLGSYHSNINSDGESNSLETRASRQHYPTETNEMPPDLGSDTTSPMLVNATKKQDNISRRQQQQKSSAKSDKESPEIVANHTHVHDNYSQRQPDADSNIATPDILVKETKVQGIISQRRQPWNQNSNFTHSKSSSIAVSNKVGKNSKFAYAFLLGGAMSKKKGTDYRGGLYGVVVAAHNLRRQGSKADIVLMVQISATTNATNLTEIEEELLQAMNIRVIYLPKASHYKLESFYSLMMEKFRILQLEEYSRVLYLDADMLPMCNLDYMMELSERGKLLQDNVVLAYKGEPASGGFFVLKPSATDYDELVNIIKTTERKYLKLEYPHWDAVEGWGHVIDGSDVWKATKWKNGTKWDFYGAQADQGLLYYWTKYFKKSVSIINNQKVEQWGTKSGTDDLQRLRISLYMLDDHVCTNTERGGKSRETTPYENFLHFTGNSKPWYKNLTTLENAVNFQSNQTKLDHFDNYEYWFWLLKDALQKTGLQDRISLDFINPERLVASLGKTPSFDQRAQYIRLKCQNGWRQYEYEETEVSQTSVPGDRDRKNDECFEYMKIEAAKSDSQDKNLATSQENFAEDSDTRKWAYVFLLGGARSELRYTEYVPGLYSVVASAQQLRKLGSRADFVLMVQIAAGSPYEKLTDFEEEMLQKMNIKIIYIPKFASSSLECFYSLMMEKFRILKLTEYSRVMYLDYDVLPTCNLDYLFELSDPAPELSGSQSNHSALQLKENVILAYQSEPSSGGIFILKPNLTDYDHIQRIIYEKETRLSELPYPHWDPKYGWGHVITPPDYWKDVRGRVGANWTWYGVQADQGLLYYWTKYVKKSVSIITREDVEQWDVDNWYMNANNSMVFRSSQNGENNNGPTIVKKAFTSYGCRPITGFLPSPYNDFHHLTGQAKPWYQTQDQLENPDCSKMHKRECNAQIMWYHALKEALISMNLLDGFSWDFLGTRKGPPLGHGPNEEQIAMYMMAKKKRNWTQY